MDGAFSGLVVLGSIGKQVEQAARSKAVKQHSFMASASDLCSALVPGLLPLVMMQKLEPNKHFPPQVALVMVYSTSEHN